MQNIYAHPTITYDLLGCLCVDKYNLTHAHSVRFTYMSAYVSACDVYYFVPRTYNHLGACVRVPALRLLFTHFMIYTCARIKCTRFESTPFERGHRDPFCVYADENARA